MAKESVMEFLLRKINEPSIPDNAVSMDHLQAYGFVASKLQEAITEIEQIADPNMTEEYETVQKALEILRGKK